MQGLDLGLEEGVASEFEMVDYGERVLPDLLSGDVLAARHPSDFFQQGKVDVGLHVASEPGVAVPIPRTSEIPGSVDESDLIDAGLTREAPATKPPKPPPRIVRSTSS